MDAVFDPPGSDWTPVSPTLATMRRTVLAVAVGVLAIVLSVVLAVFLDPWWLTLVWPVAALVLAWGWWYVERNRRSWGYTERDEDLLVRRGILWRELVVVPYGRMQFVDVTRGPLQRWFGVATVQLHTAAAATDAHIPGLVPAEAARLRDRLAAMGETHTAGL